VLSWSLVKFFTLIEYQFVSIMLHIMSKSIVVVLVITSLIQIATSNNKVQNVKQQQIAGKNKASGGYLGPPIPVWMLRV